MTCGAKHPDHNGVTCVRLVKCERGMMHTAQVGRFWANWHDDTTRPEPPEEVRLETIVPQESPAVEKVVQKKKRGASTKEKPAKPAEDRPLSLFD